MVDVHNKKTRSFNMSRIRSKDTKPEMLVRKYLHKKGYRFRLHDSKLPGKPDIVLRKYNTVIQIRGCFWHKHDGCRYFVLPKTRTKWWSNKLNTNVERDLRNEQLLLNMGWKTIVVWECELRKDAIEDTLSSVEKVLNDNE